MLTQRLPVVSDISSFKRWFRFLFWVLECGCVRYLSIQSVSPPGDAGQFGSSAEQPASEPAWKPGYQPLQQSTSLRTSDSLEESPPHHYD